MFRQTHFSLTSSSSSFLYHNKTQCTNNTLHNNPQHKLILKPQQRKKLHTTLQQQNHLKSSLYEHFTNVNQSLNNFHQFNYRTNSLTSLPFLCLPRLFSTMETKRENKPEIVSKFTNAYKSEFFRTALDLFRKALEQEPQSLTTNEWNYGLETLLKENQVKELFELYDKYKEEIEPNTLTFNIILQGCIETQDQTRVQELIQEMDEKQLKPTIFTCEHILKACSEFGGFEIARNYLSRVLQDPEQASLLYKHTDRLQILYENLISSALGSRESLLAFKIFRDTYENGIEFEPGFLHIILTHFLRSQTMEAIYYLVEKIHEKQWYMDYGSLFRALNVAASCGHTRGCDLIIRHMKQLNMEVDSHAQHALLHAYIVSGNVRHVMQILSSFEDSGVQLHLPTLSPLIKVFVTAPNTVDTALRTLHKLHQEDSPITAPMVNILAMGMAVNGRLSDLLSFIEQDYKNFGIQTDVHTIEAIVAACVQAEDYRKAVQVFQSMESEPTIFIVQSVLSAMIRGQMEPLFEEMLDILRNSGQPITNGFYRGIMLDCIKYQPRMVQVLQRQMEIDGITFSERQNKEFSEMEVKETMLIQDRINKKHKN